MDVAKAAERLRRIWDGEKYRAVYGCEQTLGGHQAIDERKLVEAYLAEHDPTPIDEPWLRSVGIWTGEILFVNFADDDGYHLAINQDSYGIEWVALGKVFKTRGDVRRLAAALGIELKRDQTNNVSPVDRSSMERGEVDPINFNPRAWKGTP